MAQTKTKPARPSNTDEEVRELLTEIRLLEGSARILQSRIDVISAALSETLTAIQTLEGAKGKPEGTELLLPIGSGSFIRSKIANPDAIMIGVGAGIIVEKSVDDSIKDLRLRSSDLDRARTTVNQQLGQVVNQAEDYRARLNEMVRKKGGGSVEIV
jgi:prefoldin alpha subunit